MESIRKKLEEAKKPLILAGHGVRSANQVQEFRNWIKGNHIPVVTTQLARDLLPFQDELYVGTPGVKGDRAGGLAIQNADVILIIGCSLHPTTTGYELNLFAPQAYKIQIDLDEMVLKKNAEIIHFPFPQSIENWLIQFPLPNREKTEWNTQCHKWKHLHHLKFESNRVVNTPDVNYYDVIDSLSLLAPVDATIIADAGSAFYITGQAFRVHHPGQRVILPGGLAQMGYTTSAMIGACFADPKSMVIGITGDGSIQTNIHDLGVIEYHRLNAKLFLLNNRGYSCIKNTQDRYFNGYYSGVDELTGVSRPNFRQMANAYGLHYLRTDTSKDLKDKILQALKTPGPVLFEIYTKMNQEIQPVVQSEVMPDGSMKSHGLDHMYPYLNA